MLKYILIGLVILVATFLIVAATRPDHFRVTRTASVAAPPVAVFEQINNLQNWNAWSPWAKLDPDAKNTFEGPQGGVGARFSWSGNSKVGKGTMTITESKPSELVLMKLDFIEPFTATNTTEFTIKPDGNGTAVTWSMSGQNNFVAKCMGLLMNCEKMIGGQFEQGFANLKSMVEARPQT